MWGISSAGRALAWHARGQRFDPAILHQKSTVLRRKYGAFLFAEVNFWGLHCFACTVFRLLQAVPIHPQRLTLHRFQKSMFATRFTGYTPSAVPSSSCPFFRRSALPRCCLPRRSALPHSSRALLPAASHIQTGFLRCAVPVPAGFIFRCALPCSFLLIRFNPRPAHPARIPAGGSGGRHFR